MAGVGKRGLDSADDYFPVTPDDSNDLTIEARALVIATGGVLVVQTPAGTQRTMTVPSGVFPGRVKRVYSTGTTATGITALV